MVLMVAVASPPEDAASVAAVARSETMSVTYVRTAVAYAARTLAMTRPLVLVKARAAIVRAVLRAEDEASPYVVWRACQRCNLGRERCTLTSMCSVSDLRICEPRMGFEVAILKQWWSWRSVNGV